MSLPEQWRFVGPAPIRLDPDDPPLAQVVSVSLALVVTTNQRLDGQHMGSASCDEIAN